MEPLGPFMDIFRRCVEEGNTDDLVDFLKDSRKYFQSLTKNERKQALLRVLKSDNGLISFLKNELHRPVSRNSFDKVIKEVFVLIEFIIENFHTIFRRHILQVKAICQLALIMHCSIYIKRAACSTLNKLIKTFEDKKLNLNKTIGEFITNLYKLNINERSLIFSVLGTIAKHHPQVSKLRRYKDEIFVSLFADFRSQYKPTLLNQPNNIQIYLEVLTNILNNLYKSGEVNAEYCTELYASVKCLSMPNRNVTRKFIMRAAIILLSKHMNIFSTFVYDDYHYWHKLLTDLTKERSINGQYGEQALEAFYNNLEIMLKSDDEEKNKIVFLYFRNVLKEQLMDPALDPNALRLVVHGFSKLAASCKKYFNDEVEDMFVVIARCTFPLCLRENAEYAQFENISDYQEALSEVLLYISNVSIGHIKLLIKISIFSIKRYPEFSEIRKIYTISSLIRTITNIASLNKIILDEFLHNIILDGIVWTCSHTLKIDAELHRELYNLLEYPTSYKTYLPLWCELVKPNRYKYGKMLIAQKVFDKMVDVYIMLITKVNLNTKAKEDCILSDPALSQTVENETDYRIFLNMVDLMIDIIDQMQSFPVTHTIYRFLCEIIRTSYKYPLISGFYKLVHAIIKNSELCSTLDNEDDNNTEIRELLHKYLINTLDQTMSFSNELFTACLHLIMCMPITYVPNLLNRMIPTFKIAIVKSLNDLELASVILDTLGKWVSHLSREDMKDFLLEIIPNLELFLQSKESSTELLQDIIKSNKKAIKYTTQIDNENTLESIQRRIFLFLGSLGSDILLDIVYGRALNTGSTWDKKDLLKCKFSFPDLRIEVYLDKILPRLIALARSSADRRTKVIASELLHKIVSFILGKTKQHLTEDIDRFATLYESLYPVLLDLSCDSDEVVWKLFQPLMIQLSHWLSSQFMSNSLVSDLFISSLFNGLCNGKSSIREFSGLCLAEFTTWSLRQLSTMNELNLHVHNIIKRINNFAVHPSKCRRIAAATAFNHLYKIMREHEEIIMIYWLELLYSFIISLEECNDVSIHNALNHINKVIHYKADLLNEDNLQCRKPSAFTGRTLSDAVNWLFTQCGSMDPNCRQKSMEFFLQISKCLCIYNSPTEFIESYIEKNGIQGINFIILQDLQLKGQNISYQNMLLLLRSLDLYMWLINEKLINIDYLFTDINPEKDVIFDYIRNFIYLLLQVKVQAEDKIIISKEAEQWHTLQCKIIMAIFNFITILFNLNSNIIPDFFMNEEVFELIAKCVICPRVLGFNMINVRLKEQLPLLLEQLIQVLVQKMNGSLQYSFTRKIESYAMKHRTTFLTLHGNDGIISKELREYVKGLIILENCNILSQLCQDQRTFENFEHNIEYIFNSLSKEEAGIMVCVSFHLQTLEYVRNVMELFLTNTKLSMTTKLIYLIENNDTLTGVDSIQIAHGEYFLTLFKDIIFGYILRDIDGAMVVLEDLLQTNANFALLLLEGLMLFTQHHKNKFRDYIEFVVTTIIRKFMILHRAVNNNESRKKQLINIYGICVHLMHNPMNISDMSENLYQWILQEFATEAIDIEYKTKLLENFLVCLTDMSSIYKPELVTILNTLRRDRLALSQNILSESSMDGMKVRNCFHMLVTLLPVTKSLIVFETIIFFAAGNGEYLFTEKLQESMKKYLDTIPSICALRTLEMCYTCFMDHNSFGNNSSRFDILKRFLLPMLQLCKITEIEQFYENKIKEIYTIINKAFIGNDTDKQQLIISKIGCFELVSTMFAKIDLLKIIDVNSALTKNTIDDVNNGKELLSKLYSSTLRIRLVRADNPEHKEIMRLLQCSAYNCSISIVSVKNEEQAYLSVFGENKSTNMLIWENIIDVDKNYNIKQTVEHYPINRRKLINIKKSLNQQQYNMRVKNYTYLHSYDIAESTLNEDLNAYDLNETNIIHKSNNSNKDESMYLLFDSDDLNNHECMPSICGVLIHMIQKQIYDISNRDNLSLPKLLKCFHDSMLIESNDNIKLYMLKIISNTSQLFEHHAKFFLFPITMVIYSYLITNEMNYIITDVLLTLIDWHKVAIPTETREKVWAQKLFEKLVEKVLLLKDVSSQKIIYKYNLSIIKMMAHVWQKFLQVPENLYVIMINAPKGAVDLILICLINNIYAEIICRDNILEFLLKVAENWREDEEMVLQSCEALGIILKYLKSDANYSTKLHDISEKLLSYFQQMQITLENRQIRCIYALCKNYPDIAIRYIEFITLSLSRVDSMGKAICLELFSLTISQLPKEQIVNELENMKFHNILKNRIAPCEKIALQVIHALVLILEPLDLLPLANLITPYTKHDFLEYREIVYKIFISIYNRYLNVTPYDDKIEELMSLSKHTLLGGLLDPAIKLRTEILHFWTEGSSNKTTDRLLEILNTYSPDIEDVYLPFISLTLMQALTKSVEYKSKLFDPLTTCVYKNYEIVPSWKIRNFESIVPLFAPSLASQMSQTYTQMISSIDNSGYFSISPQSQESRSNQMFLNYTRNDTNLQTFRILQPAENKRSRRFTCTQSLVTSIMKQKEMAKSVQHAEMIKKAVIKQRNSVQLYRKYRFGDFPDIEMTFSDLIESLQNLITKDQLICKDITVTIFSSIIEAIKIQQSTKFINEVISMLKQIIYNCQGSSPLMAVMLETMFKCNIIDFSPDITTKISNANNFNSIATLFLEENLIYYTDETPPPQKRMHLIGNEVNDQTNKWLQLAKLYESMNEVDVVLSIFRDKIDNRELQESSFAQIASDWTKGKSSYDSVYAVETGLIKEHCLQGLFECLSHLADWNGIDTYIKDRLDNNLGNIWNDTWKNWMFPWMFQVYLHKSLLFNEDSKFNEFKDIINLWLEDEQKLSYMKRNFGEEIAAFFLHNDEVGAREFLNATLDEIRDKWMHLHPLSVQHKKKILEKLQGISEIDLFLTRYMNTSQIAQGGHDLIRYWTKSIPSMQDDILLWNKLSLYRTNFAMLYVNHVRSSNNNSLRTMRCVEQMERISHQLSLDTINMSLSQNNKPVAIKLFSLLKEQIDNSSLLIKYKYILTAIRFQFLKGQEASIMDKKLSHFIFAWEYSHKILYESNLDVSVYIATRQNISRLATTFVQLSYEDAQFTDMLFKNDSILKELCIESSSTESVRSMLEFYCFQKMKECCTIGNTQQCYLDMSKYCYDQFCRSDNANYFKEFVNSTLKAMSHGSVEAAHYFPCILKHQHLSNDDIKEIFINNTSEIQSWLFLRWQVQLVSYLGTPIADLIIPIIERIIQDYPNALIYTLRLTMTTNPSIMNDSRMYKIRKYLLDNKELEKFLEAMQYVVQPEFYLQYYFNECIKNLSKGTATAIKALLEKIYPSSRNNRSEPRPGHIYDIFKNSGFDLTQLETMTNEREIRQYLKSLNEVLKQSFETRKNSVLLKDYSPWLCDFHGSYLEVPGQYTGYRKPMPQYHAKIMKIEPIVKVMESLRKPVRINIIGDDAKTYMFLNKFGEDLRLDQRIQQTLTIINNSLNTDQACKQRHLFVDTYQVIPLSTSLGLIQWIPNTKPLKDLIYFTIPENKYSHYESIETEYTAWIQKAGSSGYLAEQYKQAILRYDANAVTIQMNKLIAKTEWDLLRKTCMMICPSPESFITFRRNFITSYATMCAVHWILGIGDRHLSNILISIGSGKCLGIDFDQAFDAGINSMIPELMPFRLTPQILGFLKPFTQRDLFGATMVHVIKALQCNKSAILACLDIFIHEPLNWTKSINKAFKRVEEVNTDVRWLPQKRISIVEKKLSGYKPSVITVEQLKDLYSDQYLNRYSAIVNGNDGIQRIRLNMRDDKLTAEEQVECLLDQATDLNILGRTFVGWKPWL